MIAVDWTRCDGHGLCAALAPEAIRRDEWGYPIFTAPIRDERTARRIIAVCPALALRLEKAQSAPTAPRTNTHHRPM